MNLKEAFRYQNFLSKMINNIANYLYQQDYCLKTTKTHLKNKSNPDAENMTEEDNKELVASYEVIVSCVKKLIEEKKELTLAINNVKPQNYDAMIDSNKYKRMLADAMSTSLRFTQSVNTIQGSDYKFNAEGNQMPYKYDIEVKTEDRFDRAATKSIIRELFALADADSCSIDQMLVNTLVHYEPFVDVNASIEDVIEALQ